MKYPDGDEEDMGCRDMSKYLGDKFQCGLIRNPPTAAEQPASELRRERRARRVHGRSNPLDGVEEELHQYAKGAEFELPARYAEFAGTKWRLLRVYYDDSTGRQMAAYCTTEIADTIPPIDVETLPLEDLEAEYDVEASEYTRVQSWIAASAATEVVVQETSGRRQSRRVAGERPSHVRDPNSWSGGTIPNPEAASTPHEVHRLRGGRQGDDDPDYNQLDYEIPCDHEAGFMGEAVNHVYQEQYIFPFQPQIPIQIQLQQFQENPPPGPYHETSHQLQDLLDLHTTVGLAVTEFEAMNFYLVLGTNYPLLRPTVAELRRQYQPHPVPGHPGSFTTWRPLWFNLPLVQRSLLRAWSVNQSLDQLRLHHEHQRECELDPDEYDETTYQATRRGQRQTFVIIVLRPLPGGLS